MIKATDWLRSVALHSGGSRAARFRAESGPFRIRRTDGTPSEATVSLNSACAAQRTSSIQLNDGRTVEMIEHALAALTARRAFRNIVLEVDGPEVPLLGGGALEWANALEQLPTTHAVPLPVIKRWQGEFESMTLRLEPSDDFVVTLSTDFRKHHLPAVTTTWDGTWASFRSSIASARTFGFHSEAHALQSSRRALGVDRNAVVVYDDDGQADPHFATPTESEFHRHKFLDFLGDLALLGRPLIGRATASSPGHARTLHLLRLAVSEGAFGSHIGVMTP